jgi:YesN/AraC family two-component response regulator
MSARSKGLSKPSNKDDRQCSSFLPRDRGRRLERTHAPVDEISWNVGYEDPAFFRRLFKRITGVTAGAYRRKFHIPEVEVA